MEDDGCVEIEEIHEEYEVAMDEKFENEKGFNRDDSLPWDWEDQLYEEWRDLQMISEKEEE
jgi:hypothetical protein